MIAVDGEPEGVPQRCATLLNRLVSAVKRQGTQNLQYKKRIPADVRERMVGLPMLVPIGSERVAYVANAQTETIRLSLRTSDPAQGKIRLAEVSAFFETVWSSMRATAPISLTHRQAVALSGDLFRAWAADQEGGRSVGVEFNSDGTVKEITYENHLGPGAWEAALAYVDRIAGDGDEPERLEFLLGPLVDRCLRDRGIGAVTPASHEIVLREFLRALRDGFNVQQRKASGDYAPAPEQQRFPVWEDPKPTGDIDPITRAKAPQGSAAKIALRGLVAKWWAEAEKANRSRSTHEGYRRTVNAFATFLKHDDAMRVTRDDVVRFKDARVAAGASLKTVKDSDLVALKAVLGWAAVNGLIPSNPADGVKVVRTKAITTRPKGFTSEEAMAILRKSLQHVGAANENPKTTAAKRWVPWLCAYTGARVGEMVQLRKEDIRQEGNLWVLRITPEAGTVKSKAVREVVLHTHLVEMGFPMFVGASKAGPLFLVVEKHGENLRGKWQATKNRLAEFARAVIPDADVQPNHGWRHSFATIGREAGIEDSILFAIGGWAPPTVGGRYGGVTLQAQAAAFAKFPRFMAS